MQKLHKIQGSTKRIESIIEHMRSFWIDPNQRIMKETFELNETVKKALSLISRKLHSHGIQPEVVLATADLHVYGNPVHIEQVVINLIVNAIQAFDSIKSDSKCIKIVTRKEDSTAIIEVHDNGTGISEIDEKKLFDPFYSTKKPGEGMGLGLAISKLFIGEHDGKIEARNNDMGGASFIVKIPTFQS
jgi:C4-dicarboxylate-specific signal transduction histidine kinase